MALQGDVAEHEAVFSSLEVPTRRVRRPDQLGGLAGVVLPGGESTTLSMLAESAGLLAPLGEALGAGLPVLGTCAGLVLLATAVLDGRADQHVFGALDCTVRRNGYGRQAQSFEAVLGERDLAGDLGQCQGSMPAVFIRAPVVTDVGPKAEVLAYLGGPGRRRDPVVLRQGKVVATTFHPELTTDRRVHRLFLAAAAA